MTSPDSPTTSAADRRTRSRLAQFIGVLAAMTLLLTACGSSDESDQSGAVADGADRNVDDSVASSIDTDVSGVVYVAADERGEEPFAPEAEIAECQPDELITFLDANPTIAAAWADASDVEVDEIADTIRALEPMLLEQPTRVTNHGYRGGVARPFQATLDADTAVLVDDQGIPRVRCACGNPLDEPRTVESPTDDPADTEQTATTTTSTTLPTVADRANNFCAVWADVAPTVVGGPVATGATSIDQYLDWMVDGFGRLVVAAEATSGFPADALTDLQAYHADLVVAAASETGPGAGDTDLRDRVEAFIDSYCDGSETVDDTPTTPDDETTPTDDETVTSGNCGSMQFFLLIEAAEAATAAGFLVDHAAVSSEYLEALEDVTAGIDPGASFDVADLAPMLAYEAVGCEGAQAMQQLFIDSGYGHFIEGTELGS